MREFDANKATAECIQWIKDWFCHNGSDCVAVVGISGGKDSTIAATLCVKALGKDRVFGVLMPNHTQEDIDVSFQVVNHLDIKYKVINIGTSVDNILNGMTGIKISKQTINNLPARIRMATLYAVSQSMNGRVCNTCNYSEEFVGYSTLWGDSCGDFAPLMNLTVTELKQMGYVLGLPKEFIEKVPTDGLCGMTDEENLGFSYETLDNFNNGTTFLYKGIADLIDHKHKMSQFKRDIINIPHYSYYGEGERQ